MRINKTRHNGFVFEAFIDNIIRALQPRFKALQCARFQDIPVAHSNRSGIGGGVAHRMDPLCGKYGNLRHVLSLRF